MKRNRGVRKKLGVSVIEERVFKILIMGFKRVKLRQHSRPGARRKTSPKKGEPGMGLRN